jgi:hypothetical protein
MNTLSIQRPLPSMLMRVPAYLSTRATPRSWTVRVITNIAHFTHTSG